MRPLARCLPVVALLLLLPVAGVAQEARGDPDESPATRAVGDSLDSQRASTAALRVFLDCSSCDFDHIRRTILFINWMRDRRDAQVHVLITSERTGSGGREYTLEFIGLREFDGSQYTVRYTSTGTDTESEERDALTHTLELGLASFVAGTPAGKHLQLVYQPGEEGLVPASPEDDPWDFWVFTLGFGANFGGESSTSSYSLSGSATANRTTEEWKWIFVSHGSYAEDNFVLGDGEDLRSIDRSYDGSALVVNSLGDHWSLGARAWVSHSTYSNEDLNLRGGPAVEYNIFPYRESTQRQFRILYSVGVNYFDYAEETIYGVTEEVLYDQTLTASLDIVQPWGSAQLALEGSVYLNDLSANRATFYAGFDWRVFRGFMVYFSGSFSHIADQRNLPAGGATDEEILLRRKELETSFRYSLAGGISFRFGSKFANVVNPRFGF